MPKQTPLLPLLIEPEDLQKALTGEDKHAILIVDLRSGENFLRGHIEGAQLVLPSETQAGPPIPGHSPSDEQLSQLMQRIGLSEHRHVVVYDDEGGGWAGRFIWLLDEIGHEHYSYLNGGILAWTAANFPLSTEPLLNKASAIRVKNTGKHSITLPQLMATLASNSLQIWDARSPMEYRGEKVNAAKGGCIPGALNYEWTNAMDTTRNLRLKPLEQIRKELNDIGISLEKDTITHCQSHHRSGLSYLIAKLLNFKSIRAYAGSWGEWGNHPDTPVQ